MDSNKVIQSLWIGPRLSLMECLSIASYLANGHDFHLYAYDKIMNLPPGVIIKNANEILPKNSIFTYEEGAGKGSYAMFSNLFRYKLLLDKGGAWTDLDMVCIRPINLKQEYIFSSEYVLEGKDEVQKGSGAPRHCATAFIKAPQQSMIMRSCFEKTLNEVDRSTWGKTGPCLIDSEVKVYGLEQFIVPPEIFCPINWWKWGTLIKPNHNFIPAQETCCIHLWHEMWRRQSEVLKRRWRINIKIKDFVFSENTIYGALQKRYLHIRKRPIAHLFLEYIYRLLYCSPFN